MKKINIKAKMSPARKHVRFLSILERQAFALYKIAMRYMLIDIKDYLKQEKLTKSDKIGSGWTGDIPKVAVNINEISHKTISKYMELLRWSLLGDYAGKEGKKLAKKLGLLDKLTPGILQAAYLHSLDSQREHYVNLTGEEPEDLPKYLLEGSIEQIVDRTNRYINQITTQLENSIANALLRIVDNLNMNNINKIQIKASEEGELTEDLIDGTDSTIPKSWVDNELRETVNNFRPNWERAVRGELGLSSSAATHQAMNEIFGGNEKKVKVILLTSKDDRVCDFCRSASMKPNGEFKYYTMSDFKPSGWNYGKKKKDWKISVSSQHINCRCSLIYVPHGFKVNPDGELTIDKD